jgi:hypothetical protein
MPTAKLPIRLAYWHQAVTASLLAPLLGIALRLLCLITGLQLLGSESLIGSEIPDHQAPVRSVVLIDSQLVTSIPKSELVGSQIKSYFFEKTKIDFPLR